MGRGISALGAIVAFTLTTPVVLATELDTDSQLSFAGEAWPDSITEQSLTTSSRDFAPVEASTTRTAQPSLSNIDRQLSLQHLQGDTASDCNHTPNTLSFVDSKLVNHFRCSL